MSDPAERVYERLLVVRCQAGDEEAYRELVARFSPRLHYFLRKQGGRGNRADDLVQDVWLDVVRQLPRLADAGAFRAWVYRIARGKLALDARRNGHVPPMSHDVESIAAEDEAAFSPDDARQIHAMLDQLNVEHREVLLLRFLEELSYEEIAKVVGCPVGTVRSRIHYAKQALADLLRGNEGC